MQSLAAAWLVLELSHDSALALALYGAFNFGPILLFGLYAGTLVDRFVRRDLLLLTQVLAALGATAYAALTALHLITLPLVFLIAAGLGTNQALYFPARQATVLEMVGRQDLGSAVALNSTAFNLARIVGPALSGVTIARWGVPASFWLNALSYLAVIASLLTIRRRPPPEPTGASAMHLIAEAFSYIRRAPPLLSLFLVFFVAATFGANFNLVLPLLTKVVFHANADALGYLLTAQGIGSLAGALTMTATGSLLLHPQRIIAGALLFGVVEVLFLIGPSYPQTVVLLLVIGWSFAVYSIGTNTSVQLLAPDQMQGRVVSLYSTVFLGTTPIGYAFAGFVAATHGPGAAVWLGGLLTALAGIAALAYLRGIVAAPTRQR